MMEGKMSEKKIDIFELFNREKIVELKDDQGHCVKVLFVKLTQKQRKDVLETYTSSIVSSKKELYDRDAENQMYTKGLDILSKEQVIDGIKNWERVERESIADLFPVENDEDISAEEREKVQAEKLKKWEGERKIELEKEDEAELRKRLKDNTISNLAVLNAAHEMDIAFLSYACLDPETRERIFPTPDDVENLKDRRVFDELIKEMRELKELEIESFTRKAAESADFQPSGPLQNDSTKDQDSET